MIIILFPELEFLYITVYLSDVSLASYFNFKFQIYIGNFERSITLHVLNVSFQITYKMLFFISDAINKFVNKSVSQTSNFGSFLSET